MRLAIALALGACGYPELPRIASDASSGTSDSALDGAMDMPDAPPAMLVVTSPQPSPSLRVNDSEDITFTIYNQSTYPAAAPTLGVKSLTIGTMTFPPPTNTCASGIAASGNCTVVGHLTATAAGHITFDVEVSTSGVVAATKTLTATVNPACVAACGGTGTQNCCDSIVVPGTGSGQTFYRNYDIAVDAFNSLTLPATVSPFLLDKYEVSVERFRAFVAAGKGTQAAPPASGSGAHSSIASSGWDSSWDIALPATTTDLKAALVTCGYNTWTDAAGGNENLPINCVTWYEAMAFCIWDGGFLPTELEWNFAAAGGTEQRAYPWGTNIQGDAYIDCSYANYSYSPPAKCVGDPSGAANATGSESPSGNGKWGHLDMAGNVAEYVLDYNGTYPTPCSDCANLTASTERRNRGGGFADPKLVLRTASSASLAPSSRASGVGIRCARPL